MESEKNIFPSPSVVEQLLDQGGFGWFQIRLCLLCGMGYFAVGSELLSMVMTQSGVMEAFGIRDTVSFSWLPFCANLASVIGAMSIGKLSDLWGRKWPFILCIVVSSVFGIACSVAPSFAWLVFFRAFVGFGLGGLTVIDYVVLVECCPAGWRNLSTQIVFVAGCCGVIYVALLGMRRPVALDAVSGRSPTDPDCGAPSDDPHRHPQIPSGRGKDGGGVCAVG